MSTPTLVPAADRAPSLASRVVSIHATDVTEGAPAPDSFTFSLPCALRVPADDVILRPGGVKVRLVDGRALVRLPVYSDKVQTVGGSSDWVVIVKPSWGDSYAIRVPAGSSAISLADLPAVRPLTRREQQYAITGVGVTVTEGKQAGGSASYTNGQLDLNIQVPSFRPETVYPYIDQQVTAATEDVERDIRDDLDARLSQVTTAYDLAVVDGYEGTLTEWLASLQGPEGPESTVPGPPNVLSIGTVTTSAPGGQAAASITGTAPNQTLGLTIPRGEQGTRGPVGNVNVENPVPGVWDFQPEELAVEVSDVQGLAARLDALEQDTGFRSIPHKGAAGAIHVSRTGNTVTIRLVDFVPPAGNYAVHVCALPTGFRWSAQTGFLAFNPAAAAPPSLYGMYSPGQLSWSRTLPDSSLRPTVPMQAEYRFTTADAWPTTLPGSPA